MYNTYIKTQLRNKIMNNIINALFESVWEEGSVVSNCKLDLDTGEIFDIDVSDDGCDFEYLIDSFLIFEDVEYGISEGGGEFDYYLEANVLDELLLNLPNLSI